MLSTSSGLKFVYIGRFSGNMNRTTRRTGGCRSFGEKLFLYFRGRSVEIEELSVVVSKHFWKDHSESLEREVDTDVSEENDAAIFRFEVCWVMNLSVICVGCGLQGRREWIEPRASTNKTTRCHNLEEKLWICIFVYLLYALSAEKKPYTKMLKHLGVLHCSYPMCTGTVVIW